MIITVLESSSGKSLTLDDVQLNHSVRDLKQMIWKETGYGCPIHMQRLIHCGRAMEDNDRLSEYKFEVRIPPIGNWPGRNCALNIVHLVLRVGMPKPTYFARPAPKPDGPIQIHVKHFYGVMRTLRVMPNYYVEELKVVINEDKFTLPLYDMCLQFLGRTLQDGHTLADYGVSMNDTVRVNLHYSCSQRTMTGKNYETLVLARRLSRSLMRQSIPADEFPTALSFVSEDASATFVLVRSNPAMLVSGSFSACGNTSARSGEDILRLVTKEHKFETTRLAQELKHNERLEELFDKLVTGLSDLGFNEYGVDMATCIELQIAKDHRFEATSLAQELKKHNESLGELCDKLVTTIVDLGFNAREVDMAMHIKLQIATEKLSQPR